MKKVLYCIKHIQWKYIIAANNFLPAPTWNGVVGIDDVIFRIYGLLLSQQKRRFARYYRHSPADGKHWNMNRIQQMEEFKIRSVLVLQNIKSSSVYRDFGGRGNSFIVTWKLVNNPSTYFKSLVHKPIFKKGSSFTLNKAQCDLKKRELF